jgi:putative ABC transport system ATP-binding protein
MNSSEPAIVAVTGLTKTYQQGELRSPVLSDLDLTLHQGQSLTILGVSGTGKSTLLNLLAGLDVADAGQVRLAGIDLTQSSAAERARYRRDKVGFVFQFYNLIPSLTALENVLTGWEATGRGRALGLEAAREMLTAVGLGSKAQAFPDQLSGGEQQRIAIARALVKRPEVLLADEPTGNLDPKTAATATALLMQHARQCKATAIIVTHNPAISEHTDRTLVLRDGRLHTPHAQPVQNDPSPRPTGLIA